MNITDVESPFFCHGVVGRNRWSSYYYQIREVLRLCPGSILEVGIGNSVVSDYLRRRVGLYCSIDINRLARPSIWASVTDIPYQKDTFDVVLVAEVLEHLPFDRFATTLIELGRITRQHVVLSLPQAGVEIGASINLPIIGRLAFGTKVSLHRRHTFNGLHYWEINQGGYPLRRIRKTILDSGFVISREFQPYDMLYNRFFVLKKR